MATIQVPDNAGSFLVRCIRLHEQMLNEIKECRRKGIDKLAEIQCSFDIATNYVSRLTIEVQEHVFESIKEEIFFFKKLKPLFTSEAEFYTYLYHAEIFKSNVEDQSAPELESFYQRQLQRMEKFGREHPNFYAYVQEEKTSEDVVWFVRDPIDRARSSHDKLMATYLAIKRYEDFVQLELSNSLNEKL